MSMQRDIIYFVSSLSLALWLGLSRGYASDTSTPPKPEVSTATVSAEPVWITDLAVAQARAKADNKLVFMVFTGSDWCPACIQFDREILSAREFKDYAVKNLVLVLVDFPEKKHQNDALKKANDALNRTYKVEGFPTMVILDREGKEIGRRAGYVPAGAKAYIAGLESLKKKN